MKVTIDTAKIGQLVQAGKDIVFKQEAEVALAQLLKLREQIEEAINDAKTQIEKTALEYDPNFSSVQGELVKVSYRYYGGRYRIDPAHIDELDKSLYAERISYSPEVKAVDAWVEEHGALPLGINPVERQKQISIKILGEDDNEPQS